MPNTLVTRGLQVAWAVEDIPFSLSTTSSSRKRSITLSCLLISIGRRFRIPPEHLHGFYTHHTPLPTEGTLVLRIGTLCFPLHFRTTPWESNRTTAPSEMASRWLPLMERTLRNQVSRNSVALCELQELTLPCSFVNLDANLQRTQNAYCFSDPK